MKKSMLILSISLVFAFFPFYGNTANDADISIKNLKSKLTTSMDAITFEHRRLAAECAGFESPEEFEERMESKTILFPLIRKMLKLEA